MPIFRTIVTILNYRKMKYLFFIKHNFCIVLYHNYYSCGWWPWTFFSPRSKRLPRFELPAKLKLFSLLGPFWNSSWLVYRGPCFLIFQLFFIEMDYKSKSRVEFWTPLKEVTCIVSFSLWGIVMIWESKENRSNAGALWWSTSVQSVGCCLLNYE